MIMSSTSEPTRGINGEILRTDFSGAADIGDTVADRFFLKYQ